MAWKKPPQELIDLFDAIMPGPPAVKRQMFGHPAGFVNGNMFMGLFQDSFIVRLPEGGRAALMKIEGAAAFEPMPGRTMREYTTLPASVLRDRKELRSWVQAAFDYGLSLEQKEAKAKKTSKKLKA